jgi:hypothetical protein
MADLTGYGESWGGSAPVDTSQSPTAPSSSGSSGSSGKSTSRMKGARSAAGAAGKSLAESGSSMMQGAASSGYQRPVPYKRGGKVRRTGKAILHKGERVIPRGKRRKVERLMKREGMRMKARR